MGLIASVLENRGIPTVSITLLKEVTKKVLPPRSLFVPYPLGYPLGEPNNPDLQNRIIKEALTMLSTEVSEPLVKDFQA
ncbi:MAG: hypothetical protein ABIJ42_02110 [Acidobacteriota bacterium]